MGIGTAILLAAWGISFLWRYTPPEIAVRIANPEVRVTQIEPFTVTQDKPFIVTQPKPSGIARDAKTAAGDVIRREVTEFLNVKHGPGTVTTGWIYQDGSGGVPIHQYCYYRISDGDRSTKSVYIASDRNRLPNIEDGQVPDLERALAKCQWWQG